MRLLVFSDIHGDIAALERLMDIEADLYVAAGDMVNFARGLERIGAVLARRADKVYVLPGNHESEQDIARLCAAFGLNTLHGASIRAGAWHIAGLGYSSPTPFNTPGEYSETEIAERMTPFAALSPLILICHCPPLGTSLDESALGQHYGSRAVGEFLARHQPRWFFCGHIHEAAGRTLQLGATRGVNVGKRGYLLEWDETAA
jgi:Icc-related predicted phosphoesterase